MRFGFLLALALVSACSPGPDEVPERMLQANMPDGRATLKRLFAEGHLRAATQADVDAYNRAASKALPPGSPPYVDYWLEAPQAFVLLNPFQVTPDMGFLTLRRIIVPASVERNDDPKGLFSYYFLADGQCTALGSQCPGAPRYDAEKVARENHDRMLREQEQAKAAALSDDERSEAHWAESGKKDENSDRTGPLERLTE